MKVMLVQSEPASCSHYRVFSQSDFYRTRTWVEVFLKAELLLLQRGPSRPSQWFGQNGHLLQTLIIGLLVVIMGFDEDHTGRPFGASRCTQILKKKHKTG